MRLYRIENPAAFDEAPEVAMDVQLAGRRDKESPYSYIVVGGRVAISTYEEPETPIHEYLDQPWLKPNLPLDERVWFFERWLHGLAEALVLEPKSPTDFIQPVMLQRQEYREETRVLAYLVTPLGPLPTPPARPASIYGHLPFGTTTASDTVIYRWEAFPTSRRITRTTGGGTIAADTYAAPASETPFAATGFSAVARFALPNVLPACFRWELQPPANTPIECGASVPLYGQSGGGVEVKFPSFTTNRCPIADPVLLPVMWSGSIPVFAVLNWNSKLKELAGSAESGAITAITGTDPKAVSAIIGLVTLIILLVWLFDGGGFHLHD
jgi:hypothetical protein